MSKKNIAIIIQKLSGGGAERVAANMSIDLGKDYNVVLIVFDMSDATYKYGGKLYDLNLPVKNGGFGKIINIYNRIKAVKKIKKKENIICSISLMEGANIVNVLSKQNDKVIISERNLISFFITSKIARIREKYLLKKADYIVTLSEVVRKDLINNFSADPNKLVTIYNSVDTSKFSFDNQINKSNAFTIVTMGRLTKQKAQWHILRAFKKFHNEYPNSKLQILGQGELLNEYQEFVKKLGIENYVEFLGFASDPHNIIINADLFVFSSMVEGLGNVLLEALACGKAIISTDCDAGPREILAPSTDPISKTTRVEYAEYGVLIPVTVNDYFDKDELNLSYNELCLAEAMTQLYLNPEKIKEYEKKAIKRANDFTPNKITQDWKRVIEM